MPFNNSDLNRLKTCLPRSQSRKAHRKEDVVGVLIIIAYIVSWRRESDSSGTIEKRLGYENIRAAGQRTKADGHIQSVDFLLCVLLGLAQRRCHC